MYKKYNKILYQTYRQTYDLTSRKHAEVAASLLLKGNISHCICTILRQVKYNETIDINPWAYLSFISSMCGHKHTLLGNLSFTEPVAISFYKELGANTHTPSQLQ